MSENRKRDARLILRFSEDEKAKLLGRMTEVGTTNMNAFIRRMALHGYILKFELPEMNRLVMLLGNVAGNINQIAKRAKATDNIYAEDLEEMRIVYKRLCGEVKTIFDKLFRQYLSWCCFLGSTNFFVLGLNFLS